MMDAFRHDSAAVCGNRDAMGESACFSPSGKAHGFVLVLARDGRPLADVPYTIDIDDRTLHGRTDSDGRLSVDAQPLPDQIRLFVGEAMIPYTVRLNAIAPMDEASGIQARLANLGYYNGPVDNRLDETTAMALKTFQAANDLPRTGLPDAETRSLLLKCHGC